MSANSAAGLGTAPFAATAALIRRTGDAAVCCFRCCSLSRCAPRWRTRCGRRCRPRRRRSPASMPGMPRSTASASTMRRSAMVRRWCCCTAASPTPTIGDTRSRRWGPHHTVILMDSRGHGRSTRDARPYGYDLMADDVVALLDTLHVAQGRRGGLERRRASSASTWRSAIRTASAGSSPSPPTR